MPTSWKEFHPLAHGVRRSIFRFALFHQFSARPRQLLQRGAGSHLAQGGHGLDALDIGLLPLGDGVEPEDLPRLPLRLQHRLGRPGQVDGLGVR